MVSVTPAPSFFPLNLSLPLWAGFVSLGELCCFLASPKVTVKAQLWDLNLTSTAPHIFSISSLQFGDLALGVISPWHSTCLCGFCIQCSRLLSPGSSSHSGYGKCLVWTQLFSCLSLLGVWKLPHFDGFQHVVSDPFWYFDYILFTLLKKLTIRVAEAFQDIFPQIAILYFEHQSDSPYG